MRAIVLVSLSCLALGCVGVASARTTPKLRTFTTGVSAVSDGGRYVLLKGVDGRPASVIDERTRMAHPVSLPAQCDPAYQYYFGAGALLLTCDETLENPPEFSSGHFAVYDATTGTVHPLNAGNPISFPYSGGSRGVGGTWADVAGNLFNWHTDTQLSLSAPTTRDYVDLNQTNPVIRMCRPLTNPFHPFDTEHLDDRVQYARPYSLRYSNRGHGALVLHTCGQRVGRVLARGTSTTRVGGLLSAGGLITWETVRYDAATQTEHYGVHAYFATTGTRFSWSLTTKVGSDIEVTHSERAIYVTEFNGQTPTVLRARLR